MSKILAPDGRIVPAPRHGAPSGVVLHRPVEPAGVKRTLAKADEMSANDPSATSVGCAISARPGPWLC